MPNPDSPNDIYRREVDARAAQAHAPGAAPPVSDRSATWVEVPAENVGEALMQAWWVNGVDHIFFSSGSDVAWFQEATVKLRGSGRPAPELIVMLHENASVNAACGYTAVANRPVATTAHVELGLMNYGDGVHTASRGRYPVMITSGKTPSSYGGTAVGDRGQEPIWKQDLPDYGSIVRQYVKWDHELNSLENSALTVSRALQVAMDAPQGPVYMSIPRDVALSPLNGVRFPSVRQLGLPRPPAPDPDSIREAAKLLVHAESPWLTSTGVGRDPRAVGALVELSELLALPFAETGSDRVNFPASHPHYDAADALKDADVVLVIDALVPWIPHYDEPSVDARIITIGLDPIRPRNPVYEFTSDVQIAADPYLALIALRDEVDRLLTTARRQAIGQRSERLAALSNRRRAAQREEALAGAGSSPITAAYAAYELGRALDEDALMLVTPVSHGRYVTQHCPRDKPGTRLRSGSAGGGWGPGAALGAKLAAPEAFVTLTIGDGFFQYGVPNAALWAAVKYRKPFLTVVFQNNEWTTGTNDVRRQFPSGASVRTGNFEGGVMDPPPNLALLAESVGAWGRNVADGTELPAVLQEAVMTVREGTPAVVAVQV